jgi:hypothetical protein
MINSIGFSTDVVAQKWVNEMLMRKLYPYLTPVLKAVNRRFRKQCALVSGQLIKRLPIYRPIYQSKDVCTQQSFYAFQT